MLNRLAIRNYALIDNLDISFSDSLNILTGETGAGKSIILGALALLLGQRADSKYFYNQQKKCVIEGTFKLASFHLTEFFDENDLDYDPETILRREISADGKTRSFINDTPVNLILLKQLGEKLIDIHSQHATLELNDEAFQLNVLDVVAGNQNRVAEYRLLYRNRQQTIQKLNDLIAESKKSGADQNYYQFQFDELENAALKNGEQILLEKELELLTHAEEIKRNLGLVTQLLDSSDDAAAPKLKDALGYLQQTEKYLPELGELSARLQSALIDIKDISAETENIEQQTTFNEQRTSEINERLNTLYTLQKKHRVSTVPALLELKETIAATLKAILFADEDIERLKTECGLLTSELETRATRLSEQRKAVIPQIEQRASTILNDVGMPAGVLKIKCTSAPDELKPSGKDLVQYLFSANKGQEPLPVNKVASGGELSRLMLSIKSIIASSTSLPTIIFDEIDTGISGEVALKVGNILENLAENMQVIAITHLPQIASKGKSHYQVYKDNQADRSLSNIRILDPDERTLEIAKMLSGENPGEFALQNARELLNN